MILQGDTFRAEYSPAAHNFVSLRNTRSGDEWIKSAPTVPILALYAWREGEADKRELLPGAEEETGDGRIVCSRFGGFDVTVTLCLKTQGDAIVFSAQVENREPGLTIAETLCPHLSGIFLGEDYADDVLIYPHHAGERTVNPIREYSAKKAVDYWRAASLPFGDIYRREINYCGLASMSWMYYYDTQNGLYIGSHDPRFPVTGVIAESGTERTPYMGFGFRKYRRVRPGESYDTGEYRIAVSERDWHYGAEIYRGYLAPYLDFDHTPAFLEDECALSQCYNFKRAGVIEHDFGDIPALYDEGAAWGVRHMFLASWNRTGFDSFYPEYYPDMELGSAMEFRRGLDYVREQGGFSTLYINARIFDRKSDFHPSVGEKMALRDHGGAMLYETYGPEHFTVNCPSDRLWRDYLVDTAEFAFLAYGCDGVYLDQLASAEPFPCYAPGHSHADIGEFNLGNAAILRELLARMKARNPSAYLMTENCGDIYGSYTWGNLTWNGADYDEYYNVFKYTFPEFVQVNMVNPRGWEDDPDRKYQSFFADMQRAVLLGSVLWMGITTRLRPESGEYHTYAREALAFRQKLQPYLKEARYCDDAWITARRGGADASCWELPDGRRLLLCGNAGLSEDAEVRFRLPRAASSPSIAERHGLDWAVSGQPIDGDELTVSLRGERLVSIVIL